MRASDYIGISEGLRAKEVKLQNELSEINHEISSISNELDSLSSEIAILQMELNAALSEKDEDGNIDLGRVSAIRAEISSVSAEMHQCQSELSEKKSEQQTVQSQLDDVEIKKQETLSEIRQAAAIKSNNLSKLTGGMKGAYVGVGQKLQSSFQQSLGQLSQAASILGGSISISVTGSFSSSGSNAIGNTAKVGGVGTGKKQNQKNGTATKTNTQRYGLEQNDVYGFENAQDSSASSAHVLNMTKIEVPSERSSSKKRSQSGSSISQNIIGQGLSIRDNLTGISDLTKVSVELNSEKTDLLSDLPAKKQTDKLVQATLSPSEDVLTKISVDSSSDSSLAAQSGEYIPHTLKDFLNPVNYDADGHYTGDYRPPSYGSATAIDDFKKWQNNGGLNNNNFIDYRKKGDARTDIVSANDIFDILDSESPDFWTGKWSDMDKYVQMAKHIPLVRKYLDSGKSIEDIVKMKGTVGACAQYYFENPITVMKAGDAYIHCNDGRHRTVAAQLAHVEMPVTIVQEYHLNRTDSSQLNPKSQSNNASEIYENPSGSSGSYGSSGGGGSQPYIPSYHVDSEMHERDVKNGVYHDGRYDKNPTVQNINDMINGNYIGNKNTNIDMPYVIDLNGNIILGRRNGNGRNGTPTPHPTLIGGKDPQVQMAGIVHIHGGKIASYDNQSGHFKPNAKSMQVADEAFGKLPSILFKKKKG